MCGREAIRKNATGLATTVGAEALGASGLVPDPPPGSDDLLLHMLYTLTGAIDCASAMEPSHDRL